MKASEKGFWKNMPMAVHDESGRLSPSEMATALDLAKQVGKNVKVAMASEATP